jgi:hypothetical protein
VNNFLISPAFSLELQYTRFFNFCFFTPSVFGKSSFRLTTGDHPFLDRFSIEANTGRRAVIRDGEVHSVSGPFMIVGYRENSSSRGEFSFEINTFPSGSCRIQHIASMQEDGAWSNQRVDISEFTTKECQDLNVRKFPLWACMLFMVAWMFVIGHVLQSFGWMDLKSLLGWKESRTEEPVRHEERIEERLVIEEREESHSTGGEALAPDSGTATTES